MQYHEITTGPVEPGALSSGGLYKRHEKEPILSFVQVGDIEGVVSKVEMLGGKVMMPVSGDPQCRAYRHDPRQRGKPHRPLVARRPRITVISLSGKIFLLPFFPVVAFPEIKQTAKNETVPEQYQRCPDILFDSCRGISAGCSQPDCERYKIQEKITEGRSRNKRAREYQLPPRIESAPQQRYAGSHWQGGLVWREKSPMIKEIRAPNNAPIIAPPFAVFHFIVPMSDPFFGILLFI